jgi:membrane-associated protein
MVRPSWRKAGENMNQLMDIYFLQGGFIDQFVTWIIKNGGLYFLLFVIFAETGLFIGFFFPGDSLLFATGIYLDLLVNKFTGDPADTSITFGVYHALIVFMVVIASVIGNMVGYWFGKKTGPLLYERRETWLFKRHHLLKAKAFYDKYGRATIFLAKFLPIIRTFAPIVAGIVKMDRAVFFFYNLVGSLAWVLTMMLGGYFLDSWVERRFGFSLREYIEPITIVIIVITTLPVLYKLFFGKKGKEEQESQS